MITTANLIKKVRCIINETEEDYEISVISDKVRSFDDIIKELLSQAVALVQQNKGAKGGFVNVKILTSTTGLILDNGDGTGYITLPDDFVELLYCKLNVWKRPCTIIYSSSSPQAARQYNKATRAGILKPVCVEGVNTAGNKSVELFPAPAGAKVEKFLYEAMFNVNDGLNRCDKNMIDAVVYACASLVYNMFERYDAANSFMSYAMALCNGTTR